MANIYIGAPISKNENTLPPGEVSVQLNDQTIKAEDLVGDVRDFIGTEKESRDAQDRDRLTFSLKVDKDVQMRYVNTIKQELRKNNALKINYAAGKKVESDMIAADEIEADAKDAEAKQKTKNMVARETRRSKLADKADK